jgi:competence protein ComEA
MVSRVVAVVSILLLGGVLAWAGLWTFNARSQVPPVMIRTPVPTATAVIFDTATAAPLQVYVNGAVVKPDVYVLPPGSRIKQAILAAGGFTAEADTIPINLAQPLSDGMYIYVPALGETPAAPVVNEAAAAPASRSEAVNIGIGTGRININTATPEELETLPGIGPAIAQKIVDFRQANGPFTQIESILEVPGIGDGKFEQIHDLISTGN